MTLIRSKFTRVGALVLMVLLAMGTASAQTVQVAHAAPFADTVEETGVTVFVNGNEILADFQFGQIATLNAGGAPEINVSIVPVDGGDPVIAEVVELGENVTILAVGDGVRQELGLLRLSDAIDPPGSDTVNLRVVHAAPFAEEPDETEVSVRTAGGSEIAEALNGIRFGEASGFLQLAADTIDVKVTSPDGSTNLIDPLPVELPGGANVTLVAIGNGDQQPLGALALPGIGQLETRAPVDLSVTGWWGTTNSENEGVILQPIPAENRLVGTIYTFDPDGSGTPRWFTFDSCSQQAQGVECPVPGNFDGIAATATAFEFEGGQFGDGSGASGELAGDFTIEFADCDSGVAALELSSGDVLTWDIRRLVDTVPCTLDGDS